MGPLRIFQNYLHRRIAGSAWATRWVIRVRNQCELIISQRFSSREISPALNGEYLVLDQIIPAARTFIDIGANKGDWTNYILQRAGSVRQRHYLYEPGLSAYDLLRARFGECPDIDIINSALSDEAGIIDFYEVDGAGELSSALKDWAGPDVRRIRTCAWTLDEEFTRSGITFADVVKIDTEGYELKVLKGASAILSARKAGLIQFEYNRSWLEAGASLLKAYEFLGAYGYQIFMIRPDGLYLYPVRRYGEFYNFSNFLAVSPDKMPDITPIIKGSL